MRPTFILQLAGCHVAEVAKTFGDCHVAEVAKTFGDYHVAEVAKTFGDSPQKPKLLASSATLKTNEFR